MFVFLFVSFFVLLCLSMSVCYTHTAIWDEHMYHTCSYHTLHIDIVRKVIVLLYTYRIQLTLYTSVWTKSSIITFQHTNQMWNKITNANNFSHKDIVFLFLFSWAAWRKALIIHPHCMLSADIFIFFFSWVIIKLSACCCRYFDTLYAKNRRMHRVPAMWLAFTFERLIK